MEGGQNTIYKFFQCLTGLVTSSTLPCALLLPLSGARQPRLIRPLRRLIGHRPSHHLIGHCQSLLPIDHYLPLHPTGRPAPQGIGRLLPRELSLIRFHSRIHSLKRCGRYGTISSRVASMRTKAKSAQESLAACTDYGRSAAAVKHPTRGGVWWRSWSGGSRTRCTPAVLLSMRWRRFRWVSMHDIEQVNKQWIVVADVALMRPV